MVRLATPPLNEFLVSVVPARPAIENIVAFVHFANWFGVATTEVPTEVRPELGESVNPGAISRVYMPRVNIWGANIRGAHIVPDVVGGGGGPGVPGPTPNKSRLMKSHLIRTTEQWRLLLHKLIHAHFKGRGQLAQRLKLTRIKHHAPARAIAPNNPTTRSLIFFHAFFSDTSL
jgi:hypothetical protein